MKIRSWVGLVFGLLFVPTLSGCAFDLAHVKFDKTQLGPVPSETLSITLSEDVVLNDLPCGYDRTLKKDKPWILVGQIDKGNVFKPVGHCFTVECSNVFEAYLVLEEDQLYGFYLPVEKAIVMMGNPVKLPIKTLN